ncbi:MAG: hypothetical protein JWN73_5178 [Betaproteobacteria bacterium]|nr:hypothetical protein [Betaproteobacteria bacterium]
MKRLALLLALGVAALISGCAVYVPGPPTITITMATIATIKPAGERRFVRV